MTGPLRRLGILISGRGSNMIALARAVSDGAMPGVEVALVLSNVADAPGLERARELGLPTACVPSKGVPRAEHDERVGAALEDARVDLACLAGYMRILTGGFVRRFEHRLLNVHPSLLPAFPGLHAQRQALEHGVKVSGATVHLVDEQLDHGPIVAQEAVAVRDGDTEASLSDRILEAEHRIYPRAVALIASGQWRLEGRRVVSLA